MIVAEFVQAMVLGLEVPLKCFTFLSVCIDHFVYILVYNKPQNNIFSKWVYRMVISDL